MAVGVLIDSKPGAHPTTEQADRQHKSKVRRLYDIANVLISLGLIEKVSSNQILKKPVFVYVGPKKARGRPTVTPVPKFVPVTPVSLPHARSKRKLDFTTPVTGRDRARRPAQPVTLKRKWDEILEVADMELSKMNSSHM